MFRTIVLDCQTQNPSGGSCEECIAHNACNVHKRARKLERAVYFTHV